MRGRLEGVALALVLALCLLADGIMDTFGPGTFAAVSAATLATAELLRMTAAALDHRRRAKRRPPVPPPTKAGYRKPCNNPKGPLILFYTAHTIKSRRNT